MFATYNPRDDLSGGLVCLDNRSFDDIEDKRVIEQEMSKLVSGRGSDSSTSVKLRNLRLGRNFSFIVNNCKIGMAQDEITSKANFKSKTAKVRI